MIIAAIDGACRRNGKPDCIAAGGVFAVTVKQDKVVATKCIAEFETESTNQRGEALALIASLKYALEQNDEIRIITDSEYLFFAIKNEWWIGWESRNWKTTANSPVKNQDLWIKVREIINEMDMRGLDVSVAHIRGHCLPFGKVTAQRLLREDQTGNKLWKAVLKQYDTLLINKTYVLEDANELSLKNNGTKLSPKRLRLFIVLNTIADAIATQCVEIADALYKN
jgi:ribonuclease HI